MDVPAKFVKLMMMTTSEHDGEALAALRKANAMLAEANVNWDEFLHAVAMSKAAPASPAPPSKSWRAPWGDDDDGFSDIGRNAKGHYTDADDINMLFDRAYRNTRHGSGFREFLDSVHAFWEGNGFLTEKQYAAIKRSASRR